jgi:hypothetical protein
MVLRVVNLLSIKAKFDVQAIAHYSLINGTALENTSKLKPN